MIKDIAPFLELLRSGETTADEIVTVNAGVFTDEAALGLIRSAYMKQDVTADEVVSLTGAQPVLEQIHIWVADEHVGAPRALTAAREQRKAGDTPAAVASIPEVRQRVREVRRYSSILKQARSEARGVGTSPLLIGMAMAMFVLAILGIVYREKIQALLDANPGVVANIANPGRPTVAPTPGGLMDVSPPQAGIPTPMPKEPDIQIIWDDTSVFLSIPPSDCIPVWASPLPSWPYTKDGIATMLVSERRPCIQSTGIEYLGWYGPSDWVLIKRDDGNVWTPAVVLDLDVADVRSQPGAKDFQPVAGGVFPTSVPAATGEPYSPPPATPVPFVCDESTVSVALLGATGYAIGCDLGTMQAEYPGWKVVATDHAGVMAFLETLKAPPVATDAPVPTERANIGADGEVCNVGNAPYKHSIRDDATGIRGYGYSCISDADAWDKADKDLDEQLAKHKREINGG